MSWFYREVNTSETVVLVAWNGETCDLKWLWKITQAPGSNCSLPQQIKFFIDPFREVGYFKTCPINKTKSKIKSYDVGSVWKFILNANLNGAHDSLIDAKAQTTSLSISILVPLSIKSTQCSRSMHFFLPHNKMSGRKQWNQIDRYIIQRLNRWLALTLSGHHPNVIATHVHMVVLPLDLLNS